MLSGTRFHVVSLTSVVSYENLKIKKEKQGFTLILRLVSFFKLLIILKKYLENIKITEIVVFIVCFEG